MAIQDFGQKIGGARKDLWSWRGLMTSDIENFNKAERDKYIKKNNIWLKPDYEKMLNEEGYERDALYFIKNVRDSIPTGPELRYSDSEERIREKQEQYIDFINDIKQRLLEVKTSEDIDKFTLNYLVNQGYVKKAGFHRYDVMPAGEAFITNKLFKAIQMSSEAANKEATKKEFLGDNMNAIKSQYSIHTIDYSFSKDTLWNDSNRAMIVHEHDRGKSFYYPVNNELNEFILKTDMEYMRLNYLILKGNTILGVTHDYKEAERFVENQAKAISSLKEAKKTAAKEAAKEEKAARKQALKPPILAHVDRTGPEVVYKNVEGQDFLDDFKIKGGEFGNWLNEKERQANMNFAYESFRDLAKALNINDSDISLGNRLNIAFGSRGVKGAAAHYEPMREVINLTKMNGAGSLAHEYFHCIDDIAGKTLGVKGFATQKATRDNPFTELVKVMRYKEITLSSEEQVKQNQEELEKHMNEVKENLVKMVPDKNLTPELIEKRDKLINSLINLAIEKGHAGHEGFVKYDFTKRSAKPSVSNEINDFAKFVDEHSNMYKMTNQNRLWLGGKLDTIVVSQRCADKTPEPRTMRVDTDFYKNSKLVDNRYSKSTHGYWQSEIEMGARAFACYIYDKLAEQGIKNDYLTGHAFQIAGECPVFPSKEERQAINQVFDKVIQEIKDLGIVHDRVETELAVSLGDQYITIQTTDEGFDYSIIDKDFNLLDGGIIENENMTIQEALEDIKSDISNGMELKSEEVNYERITEMVDARESEKLRQARMKDDPIIDPKECRQMTFEDLLNDAKEQKSNLDKEREITTFKEMQLDIIKKTNPMLDEYHVGIREISDIKTFEEAMKDDESFCYGDFEYEDAEKALKTGTITVFSSKPIEQGGFVSTSYNMAKDYAGNGKVYSQTIDIKDVAWINGDEGQYAKVPEKELQRTSKDKER